MCAGETEETDALDSETFFESYYDRDSGAWSLRRIPSSPPQTMEQAEPTDPTGRRAPCRDSRCAAGWRGGAGDR